MTTVVNMVVNVVSTVGVILMNKYLYSQGLTQIVFLSTLHFVATSLCVWMMYLFDFFKEPDGVPPLRSFFVQSFCQCGSVAWMNLNLVVNSVGFYQISKLAAVPVILVAEYMMYGTVASTRIKFCLAVLLFGVGLATVADLQLHLTGAVVALIAVAFTAGAQLSVQYCQKKLGINSNQLAYISAPWTCLLMSLTAPIMDNLPTVRLSCWDFYTIALLVLTCVAAASINLTNFFIIGNLSPVSYQVLGHFKTCLVLILGFIFFRAPVAPANIIGIVIAVLATVVYTELKRRESLSPPPPPEDSDVEVLLQPSNFRQ
eukprot:gnl/Spiro4/25294_TR12591_c0_g1_i1.p1 gnl/Spiro4/25294_TR12591_c0_g1~~gnl/Spiro4/25294_TR12591_c0_g1_i1.p1  ORF type:complete len:315 (+),score=59.59 gnl/Spiro4/25294_TR12591_c0_g1_i1:109-1053(+)